MTGEFIERSTATGVLIAVLTTSEIHFHLLSRDSWELELDGTITNLEGGQHIVSIFVLEESRLPFSRVATVPQSVSVVKGNALYFGW